MGNNDNSNGDDDDNNEYHNNDNADDDNDDYYHYDYYNDDDYNDYGNDDSGNDANEKDNAVCSSKGFFHLSIHSAGRRKKLFGDPDESTWPRFSEDYHESLRSFWDPILELGSEFLGVLLYF